MSHKQRHGAIARLITKRIDQKEGPAFLIKLYQEAAITARAADLAGEEGPWHEIAKEWVRLVMVLSPLEDLRAREAWASGRAMLPWRKRILTKREAPKDWVENHIQFDRYRAVLAIDEATEDIT